MVASVKFDSCIGCGVCVSVCPVNAVTITDDGHARVEYGECVFCETCIEQCPVRAIEEKEVA